MRSMGLDIGEVRIGIALSDETGLIAQGLSMLTRKGWGKDLQYLIDSSNEYEVNQFVIGYPLNLDGLPGKQAQKISDFASRLRDVTPLTVILWDERFTSLSAERILIDNMPIIPLYTYVRSYQLSPDVKGYNPHILDHHHPKFIYLERD